MTSASLIHDGLPASALRLDLKPGSTPSGSVDGAWWPHSRDLAAELPPLLAALEERLGRVERTSYRIAEWEPIPRRTVIDGAVVRMGGFTTQPAATLDLVGATKRVTLLVVDPMTDPGAAERIMATAGGPDDRHTVTALLALGTA